MLLYTLLFCIVMRHINTTNMESPRISQNDISLTWILYTQMYSSIEMYRWYFGGCLGDFNSKLAVHPKFLSSKVKMSSYANLVDFQIKVRDGLSTINELMAFVNSDAIIGKLTTNEAYLEFLSEMAYLDLTPGLVFNCNINSSILSGNYFSRYPMQYIVQESISHDNSGFYSFLLVPFNVSNPMIYKHIMVTRGTKLVLNKGTPSYASSGFPLNFDYAGIAVRFAMWPNFKGLLYKTLYKYKKVPFIFCGHSLGAILSVRIMNNVFEIFPSLFHSSRVFMFNSPVVHLYTIPHVRIYPEVVVNVLTYNDLVQFTPITASQPKIFKTVMRYVEDMDGFKNSMNLHMMGPFTRASINDKHLNYTIKERDGS